MTLKRCALLGAEGRMDMVGVGGCRYYIPSLNLLGAGCVGEIRREARILGGKRALVVASRGEVGEAQAAQIGELLREGGVDSVSFCEAVPNPTVDVAVRGAEAFRAGDCDLLVAVGGGSAIDSAKAVGILVSNGGNLRDYEGYGRVALPLPRLVAISTTAGTGSEVTQFAVISDDRDHSKFTITDWRLTPCVSVNDPEMMLSMPPSLTAATGMDALTHGVEALLSTGATPITDGKAFKAVQLIRRNLPRAVQKGEDLEAREGMCYGSFLAGTAFNNAGLGLTHAMAHPLGGLYNLPHGLCNALLLPHVARFNLDASPLKMGEVALALGVGKGWHSERENGEAAVRDLFALAREVGIPSGLSSVGVRAEDLPGLAEEAMREAIGVSNPRSYTREQVLALYREAL